MKKFIAAFSFVLAVSFAQAQTDSSASGTRYEYYPDANVYYNSTAQSYWHRDSASNEWKSSAELPSGYTIDQNTQKNSFFYNGSDVWSKNAEHMKSYGKKGKVKSSKNQPTPQ